MLYDVDVEASACVLSSRYAMLCYKTLTRRSTVTFDPKIQRVHNTLLV